MNKIDEIINELCPEGVEFRELEEVCKFKRGQSITKKDVTDGSIPVIAGGQNPAYYHNVANRFNETISVSSSGAYAGFINFWTIPIFLSDSFSVDPDLKILLPKYVFYFLKNLQNEIHSSKKGGGVPHVHGSDLAKLKIPLPPLAVQEEIVKILNNFTELEAKLEAELEARKKQYEYYREELLTFGDEVEFKALGDACDYVDYRGKTPKKTADGIFLVTAKNIRRGYIDYTASQEFILENDYNLVMRRGLPEIGDVLITTEAPCGFVAQVDRKNIALAQRVIKYRSKNESLSNSFLKHYLLGGQFQKKLTKTATGSTVKGIKGSKLHKLTIPLPPLAEQERIVKILDKFDALVNDISIGLPAELKARRLQYEYYRNKLLTFNEKTMGE